VPIRDLAIQGKNSEDLESGTERKVPDSRDVAFIFTKGLYVRGLYVQGLYSTFVDFTFRDFTFVDFTFVDFTFVDFTFRDSTNRGFTCGDSKVPGKMFEDLALGDS